MTLYIRRKLRGRTVLGRLGGGSLASSVVSALAAATLAVNLLIPKGGFYLREVPITWGYLLLGVTGIAVAAESLLSRKLGLDWKSAAAFLALAGFGLLIGANLVLRPPADMSAAQIFAFLISVVVVPVLSLLVGRRLLATYGWRRVLGWIAIIAALDSAWGLVHFAAMNGAHRFLGVPFVTITGANPASVALKNINRGGVYKLVSTYNNGNIFGVNLLMWFPLVAFLGRSRWSSWLVRAALALTISRTVWIGWLAAEVGGRLLGSRRRREIIVLPLVLLGVPLAIGVASWLWFRHPLNFLFDASLGGRLTQFSGPISIFGASFDGVREVVYMSILHDFGIVGLVVFFGAWSYPVLLSWRTRHMRVAGVGLLVYLLVMASDGAFILIPTQWAYWTIASFVLFGKDRRLTRETALARGR